MKSEIIMDYESFDHISQKLTKSTLREILELIYDSWKEKELWFWDDMYISFIFDECDNWKASTYIELNNTYLRTERTLNEIYDIVCLEFNL
jgi:hypothetical protein